MATRVGKAGPSSRDKSRRARGKQEGKKINRKKKKNVLQGNGGGGVVRGGGWHGRERSRLVVIATGQEGRGSL